MGYMGILLRGTVGFASLGDGAMHCGQRRQRPPLGCPGGPSGHHLAPRIAEIPRASRGPLSTVARVMRGGRRGVSRDVGVKGFRGGSEFRA